MELSNPFKTVLTKIPLYMITLNDRGYVFISDTDIQLPCGFTIPAGTRFTFVCRKGLKDVIYRYHVLNQDNEEV